ncbi:MAG: hypothetical protein V3U24_09530 [Candidatus Neomarinimicrobiota bacterium]
MAALWDDVKKNLRVWGSAAAEKAEELGKVAATKTEELTKVSKVRLELHQLQRDLDKHFAKFGEFVFEAADKENVTNFAGNKQFITHTERAHELISQIDEKLKRIAEIKKEYENAPDTEEATPSESAEKSKSDTEA